MGQVVAYKVALRSSTTSRRLCAERGRIRHADLFEGCDSN